jgi:Na+/H+ antiporter NhaC
MSDSPYGFLSLLPPLVAIVLAVATRRVILSLLLGVFVGSLILEGGRVPAAIASMLEEHLWVSLTDENHLRVFCFTLLMGAMVGVLHQSGSMHALVRALSPLARTRRSGQLTTWMLGLVVFFDDYANSLLLGGTMRPLADRLKISREKLAYLVDSTAAPVAGLAIVSTWVAGEIGFIQDGFADLQLDGPPVDAFAVFVASIPYRFYVLWALALVPMIALLGRDFGPMLAAERRAADRADRQRSGEDAPKSKRSTGGAWYDAVIPIAVLIGVTGWLLVSTGNAKVAQDGAADASWLVRFGSGDSYLALTYGSLSGLLIAAAWTRMRGRLTWHQVRWAALQGAGQMVTALAILWLAWALSGMTTQQQLGTAVYLGGAVQQGITATWLPTIVFILSSLVAFSTGTSWGTMAIVMPLVVRVACQIVSGEPGTAVTDDPLVIASVGSVLAGAIFGDHCSPISDTTVLSSQASGCDHVAHVRTQLPYALLVAVVSILLGTLPVAMGIPVWVLLPVGTVVLVVCLLLFGQRLSISKT